MAEALGISARTLFDWTRDPQVGIPHARIGGVVMYPVEQVREWLAAKARTINANGPGASGLEGGCR